MNYSTETNTNHVCFYDTDSAECLNDPKRTSSGSFFLGNNVVSSHSKKKNFVSPSIAEAEYIALGSCCT